MDTSFIQALEFETPSPLNQWIIQCFVDATDKQEEEPKLLVKGIARLLVFLRFLTVGAAMFFLPLVSIHGKMQTAKGGELKAIRQDLAMITRESNSEGKTDSQLTLSRIERLMNLQMRDHNASRAPTWPFDTGAIGKLVAIVLSVTAILLSRLLGGVLHI